MTSAPPDTSRHTLLGWLALGAIVTVAAVRCLVTFVPDLWLEAEMWAVGASGGVTTDHHSYGPAGAALLDGLAALALLLAVVDNTRTGRRVFAAPIALWITGVVFALWHGQGAAESMRLGLNWAGALAVALTALHLGVDAVKRRVLIGALIALMAPLGLHAAHQVAVVHPATVAAYEANREEALARRGIEPGSEAQRKFEQRLYQREASGRVGLSNVFGSLVMALSLLGLGAAAAFVRVKTEDKKNLATRYTLIAVTLLGLIALALTFSKGAILAMGAASGATVTAWFGVKKMRTNATLWGSLGIGIVLFGCLAVLLRGAAGAPDTAAGERSLLFRFHYWGGASRMLADMPLTGVGPGRFAERYLQVKNPISPEDVSDPHNAMVSFASTLGFGGLAWCVLLLMLVWYAARSLTQSNTPDPIAATTTPWRPLALIGLVAMIGAFLPPLGYYGPTSIALAVIAALPALLGAKVTRDGQPGMGAALILMGPIAATALLPDVGFWLTGVTALVALMIVCASAAALDAPLARLGLFAAATGALLHSQIEMNLTHPMTAPALALLIGLAACPIASDPDPENKPRYALPGAAA
ncbi:MAG: O-antigen ligase family protein, partial [Planctomycetota bacterium]